MANDIHPEQPLDGTVTSDGYTITNVLRYATNIGGLRFDAMVEKDGNSALASVHQNSSGDWIVEKRPYRGTNLELSSMDENSRWKDYPNDGKNYGK